MSEDPTTGSVIGALLADVAPRHRRALVVGSSGLDLIEQVAAGSAETTVLVRSADEAATLAKTLVESPAHAARVVTQPAGTYDLVVALDGLDRPLVEDSPDLDWSQRLDALVAVAAPDAVLLVGLENGFSITGLLDPRPQRDRDADDPSRPASSSQFTAALARAGLSDIRTYAAITHLPDTPGHPLPAPRVDPSAGRVASDTPGLPVSGPRVDASAGRVASDTPGLPVSGPRVDASAGRRPLGLIDVGTAAATGPGRLPARLAAQALEAATADVPLLAPVSAAIDDATRAGLLGSIMPAWLAVSRAEDARAIYAATGPAVIAADLDDHGWSIQASGTATRTESSVAFSPDAVPTVVPDAGSVESVLLRLAATGDVPGFRALAAQLGDWTRSQAGLPRWDDVVIDGDVISPGVAGWVTTNPASPAERLAAAWRRFHDRLVASHHRHPWPPWMIGDDLVTSWLAMSGVDATEEVLTRGRELSAALAPPARADLPDLRTALAGAARSRTEATELAGHIAGLEETLAYRDRQLAVRVNTIRALRANLQKATAERNKLAAAQSQVRKSRLSKNLRRATIIVKPRRLARAIKRRLPGSRGQL